MKRKITNNDIKKAIRGVVTEDYEMADTYSRSSFKPTPREVEPRGVFGKYSDYIPPSVRLLSSQQLLSPRQIQQAQYSSD